MIQGRNLVLMILVSVFLTSCLGGVWTGASLVYDRHNVYKQLNDYEILVDITNALYVDKQLKSPGCSLDIAVFNGDALIAGHVPTAELFDLVRSRLSTVRGYKRLYNEIKLNQSSSHTLEDSWITTKIRSQIFADASIDPKSFKVITSDRIVYLMGEVHPEQGKKVIYIASNMAGVVRVVTLLRYYTYESKAKLKLGRDVA